MTYSPKIKEQAFNHYIQLGTQLAVRRAMKKEGVNLSRDIVSKWHKKEKWGDRAKEIREKAVAEKDKKKTITLAETLMMNDAAIVKTSETIRNKDMSIDAALRAFPQLMKIKILQEGGPTERVEGDNTLTIRQAFKLFCEERVEDKGDREEEEVDAE